MMDVFFYSLLSTAVVSLVSLIGIFSLMFKKDSLKNFLVYFVAFSVGALFGDVFFHLLPEVIEESGFSLTISWLILLGILFSFFLEKIICWRHCHLPLTKTHIHSFAYMNLFGDFVHNFLDGLTIGISYLVSLPVGIATILAVTLHEIPQEIGDFGVLVYSGFGQKKALILNFLTALSAFLGVFLSFYLYSKINNINQFLVPFAAGNFIYIAGSDLIPELHKEVKISKGLKQILSFFLGILIMYSLTYLELN